MPGLVHDGLGLSQICRVRQGKQGWHPLTALLHMPAASSGAPLLGTSREFAPGRSCLQTAQLGAFEPLVQRLTQVSVALRCSLCSIIYVVTSHAGGCHSNVHQKALRNDQVHAACCVEGLRLRHESTWEKGKPSAALLVGRR